MILGPSSSSPTRGVASLARAVTPPFPPLWGPAVALRCAPTGRSDGQKKLNALLLKLPPFSKITYFHVNF